MAYTVSAFSFIQGSPNGNGFTSDPFDSTGCNFLWFGITYYPPGGHPTLTDSRGNTWTPLTLRVTSNTNHILYWCVPTSVGTGHTVAVTGSGNYLSIHGEGWSGAHASPYFTENGATGGTGTFVLNTGSVDPSPTDGCLIISGISAPSNQTSFSVTLITKRGDITNDGQHQAAGYASFVQGTAGAINPQWSWPTNDNDCAASIAVFKPSLVNDLSTYTGEPIVRRSTF